MPRSTIAVLSSLLLLSSASSPAKASPINSVEMARPVRTRRPVAVTLGPEAFVFHVQKHGDVTLLPTLRMAANLTPRLALTASYGGYPDFIKAYAVGATVALSERALTPYAGVSAGAVTHADDDSPGSTDPFVLGVLGITYVTSFGLDLSTEVAAGYQRERGGLSGPTHRDSILMRIGLWVGYRFGSGAG